jgi:hypothetical protein
MRFVLGLSIKEIARRTGRDRNTVRRALRATAAPRYRRPSASSKLDPFKDEIHRLLGADPRLPGQRIRELIAPLAMRAARRSSMTTCARCGRCLTRRARFSGRSIGRARFASSICGGRGRRSRSGTAKRDGRGSSLPVLGYSRAGAGTLIFSTQIPELLFGIGRCSWSLGALPHTLVWDRQSGLHAGGGRPTVDYAAFCGRLKVGWHFCERADPQAKGAVERLQDFIEKASSPAARSRTSSTFRPSWTRGSISARIRACTRRCAAGRSTGSSRSGR